MIKGLEGVKFVYFDAGNVLYTFSEGLSDLSLLFCKPLKEVESFWKSNDDDICRGKLSPQDFWDLAKVKFSYEGRDINFIDFWTNHFRKIQKGHDLAYSLAKDFKIGMLSNKYKGVYKKELELDLIPNIKWDQLILSCEYGLVKPESGLFDVALEKTGLRANEVALIDDLQINCDEAIKKGWKSILFTQ